MEYALTFVGGLVFIAAAASGAIYLLNLFLVWWARKWRTMNDLRRYMWALGQLRSEGWKPGDDIQVRFERVEPDEETEPEEKGVR